MVHFKHKLTVKICGITRPEDARLALQLGSDYLGMIVYPNSPRNVNKEKMEALLPLIPEARRIWVDVEPDIVKLKQLQSKGGGIFQIHFDTSTVSIEIIREWSRVVGQKNLWLAPRIKPDQSFPASLLNEADTFVIDTFSDKTFGGTGKPGNWEHFKNLQLCYPEKKWILAGGLHPQNLEQALKKSQAYCVDINSGVESTPGIKDANKLNTLFEKLALYQAFR